MFNRDLYKSNPPQAYFRLTLLILAFFLISVKSLSQDYNLRHFNADDGLPQPFIYTVSQDFKGYLWIGTGDGLARFNGFEFENFTTADSLAGNFITCSVTTSDRMWFGHMNGRLTSYDGKKFKPLILSGNVQGPVTAMAVSPDGTVWAGTHSEGIFSVNFNGVVEHFPVPGVIIKSIGIIARNELLLGTDDGLVHCVLKNGSLALQEISGSPREKIAVIKKKLTGDFLIACEEGIYEVAVGEKFHFPKIVTFTQEMSGIQDILQDQKNNLWVCTFGAGLVRFSPSNGKYQQSVYFNKEHGGISDNCKFIFEDREGCLWAGHFGEGLTQLTPKTFFVSPPGRNVLSLWFNRQYKWLGTDSGLVKTDREGTKTFVQYKDKGVPADKISALYSPDGKELWIGTGSHGVYRLDIKTDRVQSHISGDDILSNSINTITGKGDEVWIGTKKGLCNISVKSGDVNWYSLNKGGLPHNYVNAIFVDSRNRVWVGTRSSVLAVIQNRKVNKINLNSGNGSFELSAIAEDASSRIWAGSLGKGVFMIDKSDSIANLTSKEGLFSDYCYSIVSDKSNVWVGHKGGLTKITWEFSVKPVGPMDDKVAFQFNANAVLKDSGLVWFGTDKGLLLYNPAGENLKSSAPVLNITAVKINDELVDFTKEIVLPSGNYRIRIDYLGVSLKNPSMVTYQYKLDGYEHWSEITKSTSTNYKSLSEGTYTFMLTASDGDGAETTPPLSLTIKIKKPLRKHWWFFPVLILIVGFLVFGYVKRREYKFLEEKRKLEKKVIERTAEIETQKAEIETQRDFIKERNFQITASIKYARHIQNAILPQNDLIYGLFPNHFLLCKPKDIVSGDFFWIAEKGSRVIFTVADCTGHGVPGAFMSLLGINLLNEIVNIHNITKPPIIVTRLRERIIESLQQSRSDSIMSDGMDMTLCAFDRKTRELEITGAKQDLLLIRGNMREVIKADRFAVNVEYDTYKEFTSQTIKVESGDVIYLFTDGFKDQFGGVQDRKFMSRRFYQTLQLIHHLSMEQQKIELEKKLLAWMGDNEQTDDITVLGIKF